MQISQFARTSNRLPAEWECKRIPATPAPAVTFEAAFAILVREQAGALSYHAARRRRGMADGRARAAAEDAGGRISTLPFPRADCRESSLPTSATAIRQSG